MTSLDDRYRLLKCVALGGGIRTHNAQETSTGRPVMVHILDGDDPEAVERLREQVDALPVADRSRILEMTATTGGFAIVTEFLAGLSTFPEWLGARTVTRGSVPAPSDEPEATPAPAAAKTTESFSIGRIESSHATPPRAVQAPGEFTQLFQGGGGSASDASMPAPVTPVPPVAPPAAPPIASAPVASASRAPAAVPNAAPPVSLEPGEFTSLFRPPAAPTPSDVAASPLVGGPAPLPPPSFGTPLGSAPLGSSSLASSSAAPAPFAPPPVAPPRTPPSASPPSFGTPLGAPPFGAPPAPTPATPPPASPPPVAIPPSPLAGAGFGQAPLPPVIAPPVFADPGSPVAGGTPGVPASPLGGQRAGAGPSDYTMLIRQAATPAPAVPKAATPTPAAQPAPPKRSVPLGLIIALNVVLVLAIALVLYFVFRPAPPTAEPGEPLPGSAKVPGVQTPKAPAVPTPKVPAIPTPPSAR